MDSHLQVAWNVEMAHFVLRVAYVMESAVLFGNVVSKTPTLAGWLYFGANVDSLRKSERVFSHTNTKQCVTTCSRSSLHRLRRE